MRHIFIVNPISGKGNAEKKILPSIISEAEKKGISYEIHITKCPGDGERIVREFCREAEEGEAEYRLRFYAVGGDGTLNEVVNGLVGCSKAEAALIPVGTGNDFVRNFKNPKVFFNMEAQLEGKARPVDLIHFGNRYAANMVNIGADCDVVVEAGKLRGYPLMGNGLSYLLGIIKVLSGKLGIRMHVETDDGEKRLEDWILLAVGNGQYCGGGFRGVPKATINDGYLDLSMVKWMNHWNVLQILPKYRQGTHLDSKQGEKYVEYRKCRTVTIKPETFMQASIDGEIESLGETTFTIAPEAILFSVPAGGDE